MEIPAKYGCPFRCGIVEENNKVMVYMLGIDQNGRLRSELAEPVAENIKNYLSNYRMINDLVEMRSGKIINLYFEVDIFVDKSYDKGEVAKRVIDTVYDYMDALAGSVPAGCDGLLYLPYLTTPFLNLLST